MVHLKSYKYQSVDKSFISNHILRHYVKLSLLEIKPMQHKLTSLQWNGAVKLLPMWLAPNMVTLLGFFCVLINVVFIQIYIPDLVGPGPTWVYYSFAAGLWIYSTMDNIDGKQARRTGTSSGLGELFDHGIDSLNCTLASLCETAAMGLGPSKTGAFTALVPCLPMFFSTWETYHTHTLYLGAFNGPTEGLILACSVMMISGYLGPQIWSYRVADYVALPADLPFDIPSDLTFRDLWIPIILVAFFTAHLPACVYHVAQARYRADLPLMPVFLEWTPMILFTGCCMAWLASPYSILLAENHLLVFCLTLSFVFGRLTTKIILHHLTRQPFPYWTSSMAPLVGGAVMAWLPLFGYEQVSSNFERWYIYGYLVYAMALYFTWAVRVIDRICAVLDINCLTIKKRKADSREAEAFSGELKTTSNGDVRQTKKEL
ncbi:hypothetical protein LTR99_000726 [Exophiala xenobiotica]|uniref:Ethanolaminephosphotransferase n=1 Tax=Vermiconidia calcicola TaxID=1690605 RepID=A0AAV9QML2_9PEZI|nr:hypothetical protein LTR99_000726 [Exophiala xenobiotica]KAK5439758.1 hypothetical protein LTR34_000726 [Exophiala xenobiotica]KAK5499686.1 hypothetical protein LTR55_000509 [Exophiala xenobiotica]KAK5545289.1 hypothetical protein LTR25_000296 [Vermiconidia calcicola]